MTAAMLVQEKERPEGLAAEYLREVGRHPLLAPLEDGPEAAAGESGLDLENDECIGRLLSEVDGREAEVLRLRFFEGKTLGEIAEVYGLSGERIRQIEEAALDRLREAALADEG